MFAMPYESTVRGQRFAFADLRELSPRRTKKNQATRWLEYCRRDPRERVAAKWALADVRLSEIVECPLVDPDDDEVSQLICDKRHDAERFRAIRSLTVGEFREYLLDDATHEETLHGLHAAIVPDVAAATAKLMSNKDLVLVASKIRNVTRAAIPWASEACWVCRLQPNHPSDDLGGILLSAVDGLLFGCGDAVIGVNPAIESVDTSWAPCCGVWTA